MTSEPDLVALCADIKLAIPRIDQHSSQTPVLRIQALDQLIDGEVLLKAECLQATGSFKIRGALNAMSAITGQGDINAVVAFSSGNHGIGVAYAARCLGTAATIVLPSDAPQTKIQQITSLGARIIYYDRQTEDREQIANALLVDASVALIKPYDDWHTIAGQGTCGAEIQTQIPGELDSVIVCRRGRSRRWCGYLSPVSPAEVENLYGGARRLGRSPAILCSWTEDCTHRYHSHAMRRTHGT